DALERGITALDINAQSLIDKVYHVTGEHLNIGASHIEEILDPQRNVERLAFGGGPAPHENANVLPTRNQRLAADIHSITDLEERITNSRENLFTTTRKLIEAAGTVSERRS